MKKFYNKLCDSISIISKKSTKNKSPIILFFKTQKKNIREILKESGIPKYEIKEKSVFDMLMDNSLIRPGDIRGEYVITAKGVWEYETNNNFFKLEDYINYFDKEYFNLFNGQQKPFDAKEKVVIFGFLAIRAFSEASMVDLNVDEKILEYWYEVFDKSRELLLKLEVIGQNDSDTFWRRKLKGDEITHSVFYLLRHMNDLPERTRDIFKFGGNKRYYLNLPKNIDSFKNDIKKLLEKVFDGIELIEIKKEKIINFFNEISSFYSIYVFNPESHQFSTPEYDSILNDIILFF